MQKVYLVLSILFLGGFIACNDDKETDSQFDTTLEAAILNYAEIVSANYEDALADAQELKESVDALVADPSATTLEAAKQAWLEARESYGQTEAFRFYGGPIDDEDGPEGQLNAWPLDESYIDYVVGSSNGDDPNDNSGANIINSPNEYPSITKDLIASLNEVAGEANISSGYHAAEFLLWGQDLSDGAGGGSRPFTDFATDESGTGENQDRRGTYLKEVTQLIIDDLTDLVAEWSTTGTYRTYFTSEDELENSLEKVIGALGKLSKGELAGERIYVAWDLRSKEDEHSCFSDNTHRDIVTNTLGIENVFLGSYTRTNGSKVSGTSFYDLLALKDQTLADNIKATMAASLDYAEAIEAPFDQEILAEPGRTRVQSTFQSLRAQGDLLAEAAQVFGFEFDPEDI